MESQNQNLDNQKQDRFYFLQDPSYFSGPKNEDFAMAPVGTSCFVTLTRRNPPMEIEEII